MFNEGDNRDLVGRILQQVPQGDECEIIVTNSRQSLTRFGRNAISQNTSRDTLNVTIRLITGGREGKVSVNQTDEKSLAGALQRARRIAELQAPVADRLPLTGAPNGDPTAARERTEYTPVSDWDEATAHATPEQRAVPVRAVIDRAKTADTQSSGICETAANGIVYANSHGIFAFHRGTSATLSATAQTADSAGWAIDVESTIGAIDAERVGRVAVEKALGSQAPQPLELGRHTVILEPAAVAELLRFINFLGLGAQAHLEGRAFCAGKLGEPLFDEKLTIVDDPWNDLAPGLPFDFEGIAKQKMTFIDKGRVVAIAHDRQTARMAGGDAISTGHGFPQPNTTGGFPTNLCVMPGTATLDELIADTADGVLVTKFHYLNAENPRQLKITGLTRNGTFRVRDGKIAEPLVNMRFTESLLNAFGPGNIAALGRDLIANKAFFGGAFVVPAIKLNGFTFTSHTGF